MRLVALAIAFAALTGRGSADPARVRVTVTASPGSAEHVSDVRSRLATELERATVRGSFDAAFATSVVASSSREVEITVRLTVAISDPAGRLVATARANTSVRGPRAKTTVLRGEAIDDAITAVVERLRPTSSSSSRSRRSASMVRRRRVPALARVRARHAPREASARSRCAAEGARCEPVPT
jgi:hypothetical protein